MHRDTSITVRPYTPSDHASVIRIWRAGFEELAPFVYIDVVRPFSAVLAAAAAGALWLGAPVAIPGVIAACAVALALPALGMPTLLFFLRRGIDKQQSQDMTPEALPAVWLREGQSNFLIAEAGGVVVGCVGIKGEDTLHKERRNKAWPATPGEASIWRLSVDVPARRLGVGRALMAEAERWAASRGFARVTLICGNPDSKRMYAALGYQPISVGTARGFLWRETVPARWDLLAAVKLRMLRLRVGRGNILGKEVGPGTGRR